jgi:hypothetical protein
MAKFRILARRIAAHEKSGLQSRPSCDTPYRLIVVRRRDEDDVRTAVRGTVRLHGWKQRDRMQGRANGLRHDGLSFSRNMDTLNSRF